MGTNSTYEELERRVRQLEDENRRLKDALKAKNPVINAQKNDRVGLQTVNFSNKQALFTSDWQIA